MDQVALYFPYSRVPRDEWFTQVLLYWDRAASIVPEEHSSRTEPYQSELVNHGLLEYLSPGNLLDQMDRSFVGKFLELIDQRPAQHSPPRLEFIYASKFPAKLLEALRERGLAEPAPQEPGEQWRVDVDTADCYMAHLASTASEGRPDTVPVTDNERSLASLGIPRPGHVREEIARLRYAVVKNALPTPTRAVPPRELRQFKERHRDALQRCRVALDGELANLALIDRPSLREMAAAAAIQEIADDVAVLREAMAKRRWPRITKASVGGVVAAVLGTSGQLVSAAQPSALTIMLTAGAGLAVTGPAVVDTVNAIRTPSWDPRNPLAYAAMVGRL